MDTDTNNIMRELYFNESKCSMIRSAIRDLRFAADKLASVSDSFEKEVKTLNNKAKYLELLLKKIDDSWELANTPTKYEIQNGINSWGRKDELCLKFQKKS